MALSFGDTGLRTMIDPMIIHIADHPQFFGSEFFAAIFGAVVGGMIAVVVQYIAIRDARKTREKEKRERDMALGYSLFFKVMNINSNLFHLHRYLEDEYARGQDLGLAEPWQFFTPLANSVDPVYIGTEEKTLVYLLKSEDLLEHVIHLSELHNSFLQVFDHFDRNYQQLSALLKTTDMEKNLAKVEMSDEEFMAARHLMVICNDIIEQARPLAKEYFLISEKALSLLQKTLNKAYNLGLKVETKEKYIRNLPSAAAATTSNDKATERA